MRLEATEPTYTGAAFRDLGAVSFRFPRIGAATSWGREQVGYNWQSGWVVVDVQGDFAGLDVDGKVPCVVIMSRATKSDWLVTVSGDSSLHSPFWLPILLHAGTNFHVFQ